MKKIYFAGKFNKCKQEKTLEKMLKNDYRSKLLKDAKLLTYYQPDLIVNGKFIYAGPFYCEQASNGDYTSTDCNVVLDAEYNFIKNSDIFVVVLGENFSPGTIVELGWAIQQNKQIIILYKEEPSAYNIKSEYWFAIADAVKRSKNLTIQKYQTEDEIVSLINNTFEKEF